jgi:hypothetical protein
MSVDRSGRRARFFHNLRRKTMTDERNWNEKKTWQLTYSCTYNADTCTETFFTETEARQTASFCDLDGRDIVLLIDLATREIHTIKHPLDEAGIELPGFSKEQLFDDIDKITEDYISAGIEKLTGEL